MGTVLVAKTKSFRSLIVLALCLLLLFKEGSDAKKILF